MNVDQWLILIAILACFVVSWFFSSAETVFTSLPMYKFDAIFKNKSTPFYRVIALMIKKYQLTLSAILIGNNFINVLCPLLVSIFVGQI
jgi:Mg2+/Co2+ transporter CorB